MAVSYVNHNPLLPVSQNLLAFPHTLSLPKYENIYFIITRIYYHRRANSINPDTELEDSGFGVSDCAGWVRSISFSLAVVVNNFQTYTQHSELTNTPLVRVGKHLQPQASLGKLFFLHVGLRGSAGFPWAMTRQTNLLAGNV